MISYEPLWQHMTAINPETGKRHKINELYDDPASPDRHEPIGISKPTIDRMRQGLSISLETLDRICERMGLQPGEVMEWKPGKQPEYTRPQDITDD
jgi:DNA-binding Xre family transcriptional regulator